MEKLLFTVYVCEFYSLLLSLSNWMTGTNCYITTTQKFRFPVYLIRSLHYITDNLLKSISFWIKWYTLTRLTLVFLSILFFSLFNNSPNWKRLYTPHKGGWKSASVCWSRVSHEVYIVAATCSGLWLWLEEQAKIDWTCRCCACSIALCLLLFSRSVRLSWDKRRRRLQKGAILTDESGWPKGSPNERLNQDRGKCRRVCFRLSSYLNSSGSLCVRL